MINKIIENEIYRDLFSIGGMWPATVLMSDRRYQYTHTVLEMAAQEIFLNIFLMTQVLSIVLLFLVIISASFSTDKSEIPCSVMNSFCFSLFLYNISSFVIMGTFTHKILPDVDNVYREQLLNGLYYSACFTSNALLCCKIILVVDTWWSFEKHKKRELYLPHNYRPSRLLFYSVFGWLTPVAVTLVTSILSKAFDSSDIVVIPVYYSLVIFYILEVLLVLPLFLRTSCIIYGRFYDNSNEAENLGRRNVFVTCLRLALLFGIPNIPILGFHLLLHFGLLFGWGYLYVNQYGTFLLCLYLIMNALQGSFIFFAFSYKWVRRVLEYFLGKCRIWFSLIRKNTTRSTSLELNTVQS